MTKTKQQKEEKRKERKERDGPKSLDQMIRGLIYPQERGHE